MLKAAYLVIAVGADAHLAQVDGEDGVRARTLGIHIGTRSRTGQSAQLQTLDHLREIERGESVSQEVYKRT